MNAERHAPLLRSARWTPRADESRILAQRDLASTGTTPAMRAGVRRTPRSRWIESRNLGERKEIPMKTKSMAVTVAALLAVASAAHAATITSGGIPTGVGNNTACYFRNVGSTPISLHAQGLINFTRDFTVPDFQNCNDAPLAPGRTCALIWNDIDDDTAFACTADVAGSAKNLRATAELRAPFAGGLKVAASSELR
jgi:hypothetical protein